MMLSVKIQVHLPQIKNRCFKMQVFILNYLVLLDPQTELTAVQTFHMPPYACFKLALHLMNDIDTLHLCSWNI